MSKPLALHGGPPVRKQSLPYGHHSIDEEDIAAVVQVLRSDWISQGPKVAEFEHAIADYCGAKFAVAFSSGTAALHAACTVAGLRPGDEAITTPLTFAATANAVVYCGAKPVFADIRADTLNINPAEINRRITPKTKAIIPVDFAGLPADLDPIREIAGRHKLFVIEDAAHALGGAVNGRQIGNISDMTVFSFHPVKHVTSGEGGMVTTTNGGFAERLRNFRHHGIVHSSPRRPWNYQIGEIGYDYRLSDIHCALGISQLKKLSGWVVRRQEIASRYQQALSEIGAISLPYMPPDVIHAWHLFVVLLNLDRLSVGRDMILEALRAENIGAALHYPLVHLNPLYRERFGYGEGLCPLAEAIADRMITLPLFPSMGNDDVEDVIGAVLKVLGAYHV